MGDQVSFEPIGLALAVEEIYGRVDNDDVRSFLEEQRPCLETERHG